MSDDLQSYLDRVRACRKCEGDMQRPANPILRAASPARILIASQAPGNLADVSSKPFNDPSGVRLRAWMGVSDEEFYDESRIAIAPMGFCFPGYDTKGGDLPPMKVCAPTWRDGLLARLPKLELVLAIGGYAQRWHLGRAGAKTLTENVRNWRVHLNERGVLPTPHPSWRNNAWLKKNPWFEAELLPVLRERVRALL
ncbi:uracil-DNA glycosylase family protein [Henriciella sp.]|uniref:uracil-DNA glycosylase family protein n=1 Tax=Henriciella sp. TaxID=1968823 RepID=UPI00262A08A3|nr:uracil-DNA glycosylase family protein [Henriciella sp.]